MTRSAGPTASLVTRKGVGQAVDSLDKLRSAALDSMERRLIMFFR